MMRRAVGGGGACAGVCACAWIANAIARTHVKRPIMRIVTSHLLGSTLTVTFAASSLAATITDVRVAVKAGRRDARYRGVCTSAGADRWKLATALATPAMRACIPAARRQGDA